MTGQFENVIVIDFSRCAKCDGDDDLVVAADVVQTLAKIILQANTPPHQTASGRSINFHFANRSHSIDMAVLYMCIRMLLQPK